MNYLGIGKDFSEDEARKLDVVQGFDEVPVIGTSQAVSPKCP